MTDQPTLTFLLREMPCECAEMRRQNALWTGVDGGPVTCRRCQALVLAEVQEKAIAGLESRAAFGDQCYQDRCENAYVEQSVVKEAEKRLAALQAALLELHGPPPGPLCGCVQCNDFKPCPGQALSGGTAALDAMVKEAEARNTELVFKCRDLDLGIFLAGKFRWSLATFGPGPRTRGLIEHIQKELAEIARAPLDLEEWIDVAMLAADGYCRAGGDPDEYLPRMKAKHAKNLERKWPESTSQDEAVEHVRE